MLLTNKNKIFLKFFYFLPSESKSKIFISIFLTFITNLFEILNVLFAASFAFMLAGESIGNSSKLNFLYSILNLQNFDFPTQIRLIALLFALCTFVFTLLTILSLRFRAYTASNVTLVLTNLIIKKVFNIKFRSFKKINTEEIINSLLVEGNNLNANVVRSLLEQVNAILLILFFVLFWIYFASISFIQILSLVLASVLLIIFIKYNSRKFKILGEKFIKQGEELTKLILQISNLYREYIISNKINNFIKGAINIDRRYRYIDARLSYTKVSSSFVFQALIISTFVLFLAWETSDKGLASGQLSGVAALLYTLQRSLPSFQKLLRTTNAINIGYPSLNSLLSKIEEYDKVQIQDKRQKNISKNNLSFHKEDFIKIDKLNLISPQSRGKQSKELSLEIKKQTCLGFTGSSGTGKTTILEFISGLYKPSKNKGRLICNGISLYDQNKEFISNWMRGISFVPQNPYLISGSLLENIVHLSNDNENIDLKKIQKILSLPWMKDILISLNYANKNEKSIDEGGTNLSGGQVQRIAIASALYSNNQLLLLDEVTSALDKKNEKLVLETLLEEKQRKCIIMISHKNSTLSICDEVININALPISNK